MVTELPTVAVALLVLLFSKKTNASSTLFGVFIYGTLYFGYAVIPLVSGESVSQLAALRVGGSGLAAKISALMLLTILFVYLGKRYHRAMASDHNASAVFVLAILAVLIGAFLTTIPGYSLQRQNVLVTVAMIGLLWMGHVGLKKDMESGQRLCFSSSQIALLLSVQVIAVAVAIYEVFSLRAWASFADSSGEVVYRASSILFNPNLYGIWCAILALGFSFSLHGNYLSRWITLFGLVIAFTGLFFAASRSAVLTLCVLFVAMAILIKDGRIWTRWAPFLGMLSVFSVIGVASRFFQGIYVESHGWRAVALLGERLLFYPFQLFNYLVFSDRAPKEVAISIEGRFSGELRDSGILTLYDDTGWIGVAGIVALWLTLGVWGLKVYLAQRDVPSIYAMVILVFWLFVVMAMRFQSFPAWIFIVVTLAPCVAYWRAALDAQKRSVEREGSIADIKKETER